MVTKVITHNQKLSNINAFISSLDTDNYYLFLADHISNSSPVAVADYESQVFQNAYNNMIIGKRIANTDVVPLIKNTPYASNTVYAMYDHTDTLLSDKLFYVVVDEGSYNHVYKCLDNNNGLVSTIQPNFSQISGSNTIIYRTSDGYSWKYMYTFDAALKLKFQTTEYVPAYSNTTVVASALSGVIDVIKVEGAGRKYDNWIKGSFAGVEISIGGNSSLYSISASGVKTVNNFYSNCLIYLSSGTGVGQYKTISGYYSNNVGNYIVVDSPFLTVPTNGTQYEIFPKVDIKDSGAVSQKVVARALVNASSTNSIYRVEVLNRGLGYSTYANATVLADNSVGVQSVAKLKPILPPMGGHGSNPPRELYAHSIQIYTKFSNNESNTILTKGSFSQFGIVKNPLFANVVIGFTNTVSFVPGETIYKVKPYLVSSNALSNSLSNTITLVLDPYLNNLKVSDKVHITSTFGNFKALAQINGINATALVLNAAMSATANDVNVYKINETANATISTIAGLSITVDHLSKPLGTGDFIISSGGNKGTVNSISRSGVTKGFNTYIGMYKYSGDLSLSGSFVPNETVYSTSLTTANAVLHSISNNASNTGYDLYVTNRKGDITFNNNILYGSTSSATITLTALTNPEIEFGSGEVLFIENIEPISRSSNTSETFQVIFDY